MNHKPPVPVHIAGMHRGEETVLKHGKEPGRGHGRPYRSSRDSTSINARQRGPIVPGMPHIPPA